MTANSTVLPPDPVDAIPQGARRDAHALGGHLVASIAHNVPKQGRVFAREQTTHRRGFNGLSRCVALAGVVHEQLGLHLGVAVAGPEDFSGPPAARENTVKA